MKLKTVEITWLDATMESDQLDYECAKNLKPMLRHSVGYLLANNSSGTRICMGTIDFHDTVYENTLVVPRKDIVEIRILK